MTHPEESTGHLRIYAEPPVEMPEKGNNPKNVPVKTDWLAGIKQAVVQGIRSLPRVQDQTGSSNTDTDNGLKIFQ